MKTLMKTYAVFAHLLLQARVYRNPYLKFDTVCRFLKVSPADLDELLESELGMRGEEILDNCRKHR